MIKKVIEIIKKIRGYIHEIRQIDEELKDRMQDLELLEDGYLYLGTDTMSYKDLHRNK